jgi:hypothetical protein
MSHLPQHFVREASMRHQFEILELVSLFFVDESSS